MLELARLRLPSSYDFTKPREAPLVPRNLVFEVDASMRSDGSVLMPLDMAQVDALGEILRTASRVRHHLAGGAGIRARPGCRVERVYPPADTRFFTRLQSRLNERAVAAPIYITANNGGTLSLETARARPVDTVLSGPAAGGGWRPPSWAMLPGGGNWSPSTWAAPAPTSRWLEGVAERLGLTGAVAAAEAALRVASAKMATEITKLLATAGVDPREFALVAYGGAGPTHASLLAEEAQLTAVMVPAAPGTFCALEAILADVRRDYVRTARHFIGAVPAAENGWDAIRAALAGLEAEARGWIATEAQSSARATSSSRLCWQPCR